MTPGATWQWRSGWRYGLMGLPLAFVALPLYLQLPNHYAREFGLGLASLGSLLLGVRLFDALIDPALGRWSDHLFARSTRLVLRWAAAAGVLLCLGFVWMFFPPLWVVVRGPMPLLLWLAGSLLLCTVAYSALSILHQSWGARLGGHEVQRSQVVAWREGLGLVGIVLAAVAPTVLGLQGAALLLALATLTAWWVWRTAACPVMPAKSATPVTGAEGSFDVWQPWAQVDFRRLLAVFMLNGMASAMPATLMLFFVQDRLQAPPVLQAVFLASTFVSAALALPLWLRAVARWGLARTWAAGMVLAVLVFVCAAQLGAGDWLAFGLVCVFSGVAMGTDLALPAALLNGQIQAQGVRGQAEGAYLGWWTLAAKLNLALAAGLVLPLLTALGYTPGTREPHALAMLTWAYCLLPCLLKTMALGLLTVFFIRRSP